MWLHGREPSSSASIGRRDTADKGIDSAVDMRGVNTKWRGFTWLSPASEKGAKPGFRVDGVNSLDLRERSSR